MASAAVPRYVDQDLQTAPPGHRFGLYFAMWRAEGWDRAGDEAKLRALAEVCSYSDDARRLTKELIARQQATAGALGENAITLHAQSSSPFMTGIGMEHPLENGFAFLNPYGLPYLPGSSIKGVVRSAAEELALGLWGDRCGWDMVAVWRLFGLETGASYLTGPARGAPDTLRDLGEERRTAYLDWVEGAAWDRQEVEGLIRLLLPRGEKQDAWLAKPAAFLRAVGSEQGAGLPPLDRNNLHLKGALAFWDAIIEPPDGKLEIDILNPHHGGYYQNGTPPHDAESPIPNYFLTVPPDSRFRFHVALCEPTFLSDRLTTAWRDLVEAAFTHAFDWLGFGAKTAVGYGQMARDAVAEQGAEAAAEKRKQEAELAALTLQQRALRDLAALFARSQAASLNEAGGELAQRLSQLLREAEAWAPGDRRALCDLADQIVGFLALSKKKKRERRGQIAALRTNG